MALLFSQEKVRSISKYGLLPGHQVAAKGRLHVHLALVPPGTQRRSTMEAHHELWIAVRPDVVRELDVYDNHSGTALVDERIPSKHFLFMFDSKTGDGVGFFNDERMALGNRFFMNAKKKTLAFLKAISADFKRCFELLVQKS